MLVYSSDAWRAFRIGGLQRDGALKHVPISLKNFFTTVWGYCAFCLQNAHTLVTTSAALFAYTLVVEGSNAHLVACLVLSHCAKKPMCHRKILF